MPSFAIIAEGVTDQAVLENILIGYFGDGDDEPVVNHFHPPREDDKPSAGGWTLVLRALRDRRHVQALQLNDYVVVQIDTDRCEDTGFDVPMRSPEDGRALEPLELASQVKLRLVREMGAEFFDKHGHRVVFAIAVDSIECWLLPLLYDSEPVKKAKRTGCLDAANWKLKLSRSPPLSSADGKNKDLRAYERASRDYSRPKKLHGHRDENPSLALFLRELDRIREGMSNSGIS